MRAFRHELRKRQIVGLNASALHPTSSYNNCKAERLFTNEYFGWTLIGSSRTREFTS